MSPDAHLQMTAFLGSAMAELLGMPGPSPAPASSASLWRYQRASSGTCCRQTSSPSALPAQRGSQRKGRLLEPSPLGLIAQSWRRLRSPTAPYHHLLQPHW